MFTITIIATIFAFIPHIAKGQTKKTFGNNTGGSTVDTPYISYEELNNISIDGRGYMKTLLTVRSIEQAIRILGNPKERNITEINSGGYKKSTELVYDGLRISYLETAANGIQLEVVEVTSDNHFLGIGGKKVHPGMPNNKLDQPLRKELNRSKAKRPDDDPHATIFIERKNGTKNKRGGTILEHTEIRIEQYPGSSEVKSVTFSRII